MAEPRLAELEKLLLEKTKAGEVQWEKTVTKTVFQAAFAKYTILLSGSGDSPYLSLLDEDGDIIETLSPLSAVNLGALNELKELYEMARRRALGADQALDEVLSILRSRGTKKE